MMQGVPPSEIAEQTINLAELLLERFCRSRVLLVGLLPVVEKAKYDAYEYKSVEPLEDSRGHFAKVSAVNAALASFAAERGAPGASYAGCHDLFLDRVDGSNIDRLLLKDGVHFTKPGEQLFFRCLKEDLEAAEELRKAKYVEESKEPQFRTRQASAISELQEKVTGVMYKWSYSRWGPCSGCTQGNARTRTMTCIHHDTLVPVDSASCRNLKALPLSQPCRADCPSFHWVAERWGECSRACGGGKQSREILCVASNGTTVDGDLCEEQAAREEGNSNSKQQQQQSLRATQRCNTHECGFPRLCSSDDVCPLNSECRLLKCSSNACKRHEARLPDGASSAALERLREVRGYLERPVPASEPQQPGSRGAAGRGPHRFYSADLRVANAPGPEDCLQQQQGPSPSGGGCSSGPPLDQLPWYIRLKSYTEAKEWNLQTCYSYCKAHGECLATSADNGTCISRGCRQEQACKSLATDFHAPGVTECLHTGGCRLEGCRCLPGFTGPDCSTPLELRCPLGQLPAKGGCCSGAVASDGTCCESGKLGADGTCCHSGKLDACGACDGSAAAVDVLGVCCRGSLDAGGRCCESLRVDECGVCGGDGTSCAFRSSGRIAMKGTGASLAEVTARLREAVESAAAVSLGGGGGSSASEPLGEVVVEDITVEVDGAGKLEAVVAEFAIYLDVGAEQQQQQLKGAGAVEGLVARILGDIRETHSIAELGEARRSGVCGNGICEVGESMFSGALEANLCREDCPFDDSPIRCDLCRFGTCTRATGACECFHGYTGSWCDECDKGYIRTDGACVMAVVTADDDDDVDAEVAEVALPGTAAAASVRSSAATNSLGGPGGRAPPADGVLIALAAVACFLMVALLALMVYHVLWRRRAAAELAADSHGTLPPKRTTHANPLDGDESLLPTDEPVQGIRSIGKGLRWSNESDSQRKPGDSAGGASDEGSGTPSNAGLDRS